MVSIPSDLRKNKEKIIGNMDLRESACLFLGLALAISILYYIRVVLGYSRILIAAFIAGLFTIPFIVIGFKKINGMKIDDYFKVFINNKILANERRLPICLNQEMTVKNKKYELIRYYKINNKNDLICLRQHLINNKKGLILTEYIDWKNEQYVIFRLDGTELIAEQIRRNKKLIADKIAEIKDFVSNEILVLKKAKLGYENKEKINDLKQRLKRGKISKEERQSIKKSIKQLKTMLMEEIKQKKKSKRDMLNTLDLKLENLKSQKKSLQNKTFDDLKNEVNIFEDLNGVNAERVIVRKTTPKNRINLLNKKHVVHDMANKDDVISNLHDKISKNENEMYHLNLFCKSCFKNFINSITDKIVFINKDDMVDIFFCGAPDIELVDYNTLDKCLNIYQITILGLEARNIYNHYRKINDIGEIL
jgi:hypothetical protein